MSEYFSELFYGKSTDLTEQCWFKFNRDTNLVYSQLTISKTLIAIECIN